MDEENPFGKDKLSFHPLTYYLNALIYDNTDKFRDTITYSKEENLLENYLKIFYPLIKAHIIVKPNKKFYFDISRLHPPNLGIRYGYPNVEKIISILKESGFYNIKLKLTPEKTELVIPPENWYSPQNAPLGIYQVEITSDFDKESDLHKKVMVASTNSKKVREICIKEFVLASSDNLTVKYIGEAIPNTKEGILFQ